MKVKAAKMLIWAGLGLIFASLASGVSVNWLVYSISVTVLLVALMFLDFEERHADPRTIALTAALVALTVASRQLLHGIEFSPVFFIVILSGYVFGASVGFTVGALSMFTSNFFLGQGPWTPFQMFGLGCVGGLCAFAPKPGRHEVLVLMIYGVASAYLYGMLTDVFSWMVFVPAHNMESFIGMLLSGMLANTMRAAGNVFFMATMGEPLLKVLRRFRRRLTYERVNGIP